MTTPVETVQNFYAALASGNAPIALGLMADDIEWITMWHYKDAADEGMERIHAGSFGIHS